MLGLFCVHVTLPFGRGPNIRDKQYACKNRIQIQEAKYNKNPKTGCITPPAPAMHERIELSIHDISNIRKIRLFLMKFGTDLKTILYTHVTK